MVVMMVVVVETRLDDVRWRPDLTRGCPRVGAGRRLGRDDLWREGLVVGDPVAVPELPVLPLGQGAAVAELGAARREGGAAVAPLDPLRPAICNVCNVCNVNYVQPLTIPIYLYFSPERRGGTASLSHAVPEQPRPGARG